MKLAISAVCEAFHESCVGTRVKENYRDVVRQCVVDAIMGKHDPSQDQKVGGQMYLDLPSGVNSSVWAGVGKRTSDLRDYVVRERRGRLDMYLRRRCAASVEKVAAVVYTIEAYAADPQVGEIPGEMARLADVQATHVLVALLAFAGPVSPVDPWRFVVNLAGGNLAYALKSAEDLHAEAGMIEAYHREWCVVAD
jgi:hypothetical protein